MCWWWNGRTELLINFTCQCVIEFHTFFPCRRIRFCVNTSHGFSAFKQRHLLIDWMLVRFAFFLNVLYSTRLIALIGQCKPLRVEFRKHAKQPLAVIFRGSILCLFKYFIYFTACISVGTFFCLTYLMVIVKVVVC